MGIKGFCKKGLACIFNVRVTDTNQPSQHRMPPDQVLKKHKKDKKIKYLVYCHKRQQSFTLLVFSVDRLISHQYLEVSGYL